MRKFNSVSGCVCSLYKKKSYFEVSKNFDKKFYMYNSTIYTCSSSFARSQFFFLVYVKWENLSSEKPYFLALNFVFLYTSHDKSIFHEMTLWTHSTWRCTYEFFISIKKKIQLKQYKSDQIFLCKGASNTANEHLCASIQPIGDPKFSMSG
jgi:hypothetical protein